MKRAKAQGPVGQRIVEYYQSLLDYPLESAIYPLINWVQMDIGEYNTSLYSVARETTFVLDIKRSM